MGSDLLPGSQSSGDREGKPLDLDADAGLGRWVDTVALLLIVLLLLLAPLLYDLALCLWAR